VNFFTHNKRVHNKSDRFRGKYAIAFASILITGLAGIMAHLTNKGQGQATAASVRVDAIADVFGLLYRVSAGSNLLGTYYQRLDGTWIAQSDDEKQGFAEPGEACLWLQR
jgi:hypothetical protein